jgi:hypothetical protein
MVKKWILKWLKKHPKVVGAIFTFGFYMTELVDPMTCSSCENPGP